MICAWSGPAVYDETGDKVPAVGEKTATCTLSERETSLPTK